MAQAKYKRAIEKPINLHFRCRLCEGVLIITSAIALFLLLALLTYHNSDPGWSHTTTTTKIANIDGYVGAYLADILFCAVGFLAYLFPFMLVYA